MSTSRWSVQWIATALALGGILPSQEPPDWSQRVGQRIREELFNREVPSVSLAVARNGQILWEAGFGWANREDRVPATENTIYRLASVSKPITATGLMLLVQAGDLDLDHPVNRHLGASKLRSMTGQPELATLRMLANHTAGLTTFYNDYFEDEPGGPPSMEETIRRWGVLMTPPGQQHVYSNLGYGILAYIIERTSGVPFSDCMATNVFEPLGMDSTFVDMRADLEDRVAIPYMPGGHRFPPYRSTSSGAGGVLSSAHDLVRFGMFHLENHLQGQEPILTPESVEEMHRATATAPLAFADVGYGVGWRSWTSDRGEHPVVEHTGQMEGATAILTLVPEQDLAIAVLANKACFLADLARNLVVQELLGVRNLDAPRRVTTPRPDFVARLWSQVQGRWTGRIHAYDGDVPLVLEVEDRKVHIRTGDGDWIDAGGAEVRGDHLRFTVPGAQVDGSEWRRGPTVRTFALRPGDGKITGTVFADAAPDPVRGVPFGLTLWVSLEREGGELLPLSQLVGLQPVDARALHAQLRGRRGDVLMER